LSNLPMLSWRDVEVVKKERVLYLIGKKAAMLFTFIRKQTVLWCFPNTKKSNGTMREILREMDPTEADFLKLLKKH
jgi:hypothetical protein